MILNGVEIRDSFAEAFPMVGTRLIITADTAKWAMIAAKTVTGFATSVIGCGCEGGVEREIPESETPDGRPGVSVLFFTMDLKGLQTVVPNRIGQCVLTSPTSACYAGMEGGAKVSIGKALRYFGDGWQIAKNVDGRRIWRVPVMEGEFVCDHDTGSVSGVGGGNILILGASRAETLAAAEVAVEAMQKVEGCILPFPGGIVRSGSKVGSRYKGMFASSNNAYCPTLRAQTETKLTPEVASVQEIVIDGVSFEAVSACTRAGIEALVALGRDKGVVAIDAGNYGGNLGPFHFKLREIMA
ncbi:formylmethanofuran--tetrahydromethanopterin formyltransferase [Methylopila jiangsuensis]|uniref:Formylmethanofuran--tetrahydromethanopterin formyltransferase n=1 Tax=Methylopila jiangsuensis TaxID=586230 RepID=A0A9W6JE77_9HYPH|nr:formylmethanofuran--tetrahydromethanopterin N-formyltransferase [Methylopila jiangsuensis]MDR6286186.1 formylmethanofuran--tetrahydromethanopterin N-formyltransferase [Methylopila jiangsuensis]GLK75946.1 formylmethanofuran--tetrahydromethanopterin formyltransferase [Methylopila jiangsuensis]